MTKQDYDRLSEGEKIIANELIQTRKEVAELRGLLTEAVEIDVKTDNADTASEPSGC